MSHEPHSTNHKGSPLPNTEREQLASAVHVHGISREARKCPRCDFHLYAKPIPRPVRFHDLRHTAATLMLKDGVSLAVVSKLLRHSDPKLTSEVYGHLELEDMRRGVDRLDFGPAQIPPTAAAPLLEVEAVPAALAAGAAMSAQQVRSLKTVGSRKDEARNSQTESRASMSGRLDLKQSGVAEPRGASQGNAADLLWFAAGPAEREPTTQGLRVPLCHLANEAPPPDTASVASALSAALTGWLQSPDPDQLSRGLLDIVTRLAAWQRGGGR